MLHALLHRKLDPLNEEPERLEDVLTSTVFGTLVLVDAWEELGSWLGVPAEVVAASANRECWFWPRLGNVEPDVVLRLGGALVVVEAKLRSGRHDLAEHGDERPVDQIVRQHQSLTSPRGQRMSYDEVMERAIAECALRQVFVVDGRRHARARREFDESRKDPLLQGADLQLVTWQDLFRLILGMKRPLARWAIDLRAYLEHVGLDTFEGIGVRLGRADESGRILRWRQGRPSRFSRGMREVLSAFSGSHAWRVLLSWRHEKPAALRTRGLQDLEPVVVAAGTARALLTWRPSPKGER